METDEFPEETRGQRSPRRPSWRPTKSLPKFPADARQNSCKPHRRCSNSSIGSKRRADRATPRTISRWSSRWGRSIRRPKAFSARGEEGRGQREQRPRERGRQPESRRSGSGRRKRSRSTDRRDQRTRSPSRMPRTSLPLKFVEIFWIA